MVALDLAFPHGGLMWRDWVTERNTLVYFCEPATVEALFRHKVDTYTNLGFFFFGSLMLAFARRDRRVEAGGFAMVHSVWSVWFGLALLSTFVGSTLFHASLTRSGEALDLAGVYAAALLPGFFNVHRLGRLWLKRRIPAAPFLIAWGIFWLGTSLFIFRLSSRIVVPSGIALIGITGFLLWLRVHPRNGWWYAAGSLTLTALAATFFIFDILKVGCDPGSWYQAHGLWHVLAASAAGAYYGFMRRLS